MENHALPIAQRAGAQQHCILTSSRRLRAVCPISTRCLLNHHSSLQVTPAVFSDMKRQLKQREDGGWARVQWDIVRVSGRGGAPSP